MLVTQATRLQTLIDEIQKCCDERKFYENRKFGLPFAEIRCLLLFKDERYLTVKGIAHKLDVAKSRVTKLVSGLLEKGMVERIEDPQDSRVKLICLTPDGKGRIKEIEDFHNSVYQELLGRIPPEERSTALFYLEQIRDCMEAVKQTLTLG
jgi:DNA-binding MarR family transcriptional regulator